MDITKILSTIKGKVLDATNFELLANAYDLQQQNITQLKENNTAIKDNNALLKEKLEHTEQTIRKQAVKIEELKSQQTIPQETLSDDEVSILRTCIEHDKTDFTESWVQSLTKIGNVKLETALEELCEKDFLSYSHSIMGEESSYYLTTEGKKVALSL